MTYLGRLQHQRETVAAAIGGEPRVAGAERKPRRGAVDQSERKTGTAGAPAPARSSGLSGAMLRQTIGDLFDRGAELGLSPSLVALHARALEQEVAGLEKLSRAID